MVLELSSRASNCFSRKVHLVFFVFDVVMLEGRDVTGGPRRKDVGCLTSILSRGSVSRYGID